MFSYRLFRLLRLAAVIHNMWHAARGRMLTYSSIAVQSYFAYILLCGAEAEKVCHLQFISGGVRTCHIEFVDVTKYPNLSQSSIKFSFTALFF